MAKDMFGVDFGRILANKCLGTNPEIEFFVIDLTQGVVIEWPYARVDIREGRVYLYAAVTPTKIAAEILRNLQEFVLDPFRRRHPTIPPPPKKQLPQKAPVPLPPAPDEVVIDMRKTPEGSYEK